MLFFISSISKSALEYSSVATWRFPMIIAKQYKIPIISYFRFSNVYLMISVAHIRRRLFKNEMQQTSQAPS